MKKKTYPLFLILIILLLILSVLGQLGSLWWGFDLLSLFHDRYFVTALIYLLIVSLMRFWRLSLLVLLALLFNAWLLLPYAPNLANSSPTSSNAKTFSLVSYNLYYQNNLIDSAITEIKSLDADVVYLMEYSTAMQADIEAALTDYPYQIIEPSSRTMGVALFSKLPLEDVVVHRFQATRIPIIDAVLSIEDERVQLVAGHPWPPLFARWAPLHRAQMADIALVASQAKHPLIVAGDFNASQWSYVVSSLANQMGLKDARRGFGLRHTFHIAPLVTIPLDHVYHSDALEVLKFQLGNRGGSDHNPLKVDFRLN